MSTALMFPALVVFITLSPLFAPSWMQLLRNFLAEGNMMLALRQTFPVPVDWRSFNTDDVLMTLKSSLSSSIDSFYNKVFKRHGLVVPGLEQYQASIQHINHYNQYANYGSFHGFQGTNAGSLQQTFGGGKQAA